MIEIKIIKKNEIDITFKNSKGLEQIIVCSIVNGKFIVDLCNADVKVFNKYEKM